MVYFYVGLLGALLGLSELLSRYRDNPLAAVVSVAGLLYMALNVVIGIAALMVIQIVQPAGLVDVTPADTTDDAKILLYQVLVAGLGGAAFFRTSIAKTKVGDVEIGVGPSFVIDASLGATDRAIDRNRATARVLSVPDLMRGIPADFAALELTDFCVTAMQNLPAAEEKTLKTRVASYASTDEAAEEVRSMLIGLAITEYVGLDVLKSAITQLSDEIELAKQATETKKSDEHTQSARSQVAAFLATAQPGGAPVEQSASTDGNSETATDTPHDRPPDPA